MEIQRKLVAILYILLGGNALWDVLEGLSRNYFNLNFAVVMLFFGIGLLRRTEFSRKASRIVAWFWSIFAAIALVGILVDGDWVPVTVAGMDHTSGKLLLTAFVIAFGALFQWCDWVLRHPQVRGGAAAQRIDGVG